MFNVYRYVYIPIVLYYTGSGKILQYFAHVLMMQQDIREIRRLIAVNIRLQSNEFARGKSETLFTSANR